MIRHLVSRAYPEYTTIFMLFLHTEGKCGKFNIVCGKCAQLGTRASLCDKFWFGREIVKNMPHIKYMNKQINQFIGFLK